MPALEIEDRSPKVAICNKIPKRALSVGTLSCVDSANSISDKTAHAVTDFENAPVFLEDRFQNLTKCRRFLDLVKSSIHFSKSSGWRKL